MFRIIKRAFDFAVSLSAVIVLSPLFLIIAVAIKIDSKGPVFFLHRRVGYHGRPVYLIKFRSMVDGAEQMISDFTPEQRAEWEDNFKLEDDKRVTRVGKFLRRTSLDELPQLFNIIAGSMSIVGPRPVVERELEKYGENKEKFLSMKPGLTGFWASHGRSNTTYEHRMMLELYYIDHASLWLDLKIMIKTVFCVISGDGAK